jgi:hypothetical protein
MRRGGDVSVIKPQSAHWHAIIVRVALVLLGAILTACARAPVAPPGETPISLPSECMAPAGPVDGQLLAIDPNRSELRLFVYRGGQLARLGHNHIIASRDLRGYAIVTKPLAGSRFVLCVPVERLVVDDPKLRAEAGSDFATEVSESAVAGTRRNMLSETQLDGVHYPFIIVLGHVVNQAPPQVTLEVTLRVRGAVYTTRVATRFEQRGQGVSASGDLQLRQTALGIQPYTAVFGALVVRDEITAQFRVSAIAVRR